MDEEVRRQIISPDEELAEGWERLPDGETHLRGVWAGTGEGLEGCWQVAIFAQEYFRQDPLGLELRQRLQTALRAVPGVTDAKEQDNETWLVSGSPSGVALCRAAANILDELADRMRRFSPQPGARSSGGRPEPVKGAPPAHPFGQTLDR